MSMYALVDANNFFVSCERVFRPDLAQKPVVVLSNNDGCVIARSNESKALGIKMGQPVFEIKELIKSLNVTVFSANFELYCDFSARMMRILKTFAPQLEIYSVDEAFLDFSHVSPSDLPLLGHTVRKTIERNLSLPVCVGIARTKTLAKLCNGVAKKNTRHQGVFIYDAPPLDLKGPPSPSPLLKNISINEVWGIGRAYTHMLERLHIKTAYDFACLPESWVRPRMGIFGARVLRELQGYSCFSLEHLKPPQKSIIVSRSLKSATSSFEDLKEALFTHAVLGGEKLRRQGLVTKEISVFISTSPHPKGPYYAKEASTLLPLPTRLTPALLRAVLQGLEKIFKPGIFYKKAGIVLRQTHPPEADQQGFFDPPPKDSPKLMASLDALNQKYGRNTVFFAGQGITRPWQQTPHSRSPRYTTRFDELCWVR